MWLCDGSKLALLIKPSNQFIEKRLTQRRQQQLLIGDCPVDQRFFIQMTHGPPAEVPGHSINLVKFAGLARVPVVVGIEHHRTEQRAEPGDVGVLGGSAEVGQTLGRPAVLVGERPGCRAQPTIVGFAALGLADDLHEPREPTIGTSRVQPRPARHQVGEPPVMVGIVVEDRCDVLGAPQCLDSFLVATPESSSVASSVSNLKSQRPMPMEIPAPQKTTSRSASSTTMIGKGRFGPPWTMSVYDMATQDRWTRIGGRGTMSRRLLEPASWRQLG